MILMIFHLFCMIDDDWRINCQSKISTGKSTVKIQYFLRSINQDRHTEAPILPDDGGSQKGGTREATRGPHPRVARQPWPAPPLCQHPDF